MSNVGTIGPLFHTFPELTAPSIIRDVQFCELSHDDFFTWNGDGYVKSGEDRAVSESNYDTFLFHSDEWVKVEQ